MTNNCKHRKVDTRVNSWQSGCESLGEPLFYGRSLPVTGKQLEMSTCDRDGVKGGGMHGRKSRSKSGESLCGSGAPNPEKL